MPTQWTALKNRGSIRSRVINPENRGGEPGRAAWAASELGPRRKGSAWVSVDPGRPSPSPGSTAPE